MMQPPVPLLLMLGSPLQLLIIGLIVLIVFGAGRLGEVGKGLGEGIKNFKKGLAGDDGDGAKAKAGDPNASLPKGEPESPRPRSEVSGGPETARADETNRDHGST